MDFFLPFLILLPGAFFAPVIHEFVKARVSVSLGDPTPKRNGFITCNPFRYFEPLGFIMMIFFQVGWGQPVKTSPYGYRDRSKGIALTYATPMVVNLFIGMLTIFLLSVFSGVLSDYDILHTTIKMFGVLNIRLAIFNLIPIHPMAMSKIIHIFVSPETSMQLNHREKYLQILLLFLILPIFSNVSMLESFISPVTNIFIKAVS